MERGNPARDELERMREEFSQLARECAESPTCPCAVAGEWAVEHSSAFEWRCPGWCINVSAIGAELRGDAPREELPDGAHPEDIPF